MNRIGSSLISHPSYFFWGWMMGNEIVAADMEGTLSAGVTWRGLRDYLRAHGRASAYRTFFWRNLFAVLRYRLGLGNTQQFREDWIVGVLGLYAGFSEAEFAEAGEWVIARELWPLRRQAVLAELAEHRAQGRRVVLASGMFQPLLALWAQRLGAEAYGTPLEWVDGRLTGRVAEPFNTGERKAETVRGVLAESGARLVAAYGDTWSDRFMLQMAEEATAVLPDKQLRQLAQTNQWRIIGQ
jgi:HAD superfamily phosphoserine phosphatase-like hydrolase